MRRAWTAVSCLVSTVALAALGAAAGARVGWLHSPDLPTDAAAIRLVLQDVLPGGTVTGIERHDAVFFAPKAAADGRLATVLLGTDDINAGTSR